ncbi:hypothetical protein Efla_006164 [Eimeria flavescens]
MLGLERGPKVAGWRVGRELEGPVPRVELVGLEAEMGGLVAGWELAGPGLEADLVSLDGEAQVSRLGAREGLAGLVLAAEMAGSEAMDAPHDLGRRNLAGLGAQDDLGGLGEGGEVLGLEAQVDVDGLVRGGGLVGLEARVDVDGVVRGAGLAPDNLGGVVMGRGVAGLEGDLGGLARGTEELGLGAQDDLGGLARGTEEFGRDRSPGPPEPMPKLEKLVTLLLMDEGRDAGGADLVSLRRSIAAARARSALWRPAESTSERISSEVLRTVSTCAPRVGGSGRGALLTFLAIYFLLENHCVQVDLSFYELALQIRKHLPFLLEGPMTRLKLLAGPKNLFHLLRSLGRSFSGKRASIEGPRKPSAAALELPQTCCDEKNHCNAAQDDHSRGKTPRQMNDTRDSAHTAARPGGPHIVPRRTKDLRLYENQRRNVFQYSKALRIFPSGIGNLFLVPAEVSEA